MVSKCLYHSGKYRAVYEFPSNSTAALWHEGVQALKQHMIDLNERPSMPTQDVLASLQVWFDTLSDFQTLWGSSVVPPDVVEAAEKNNEHLQANGASRCPMRQCPGRVECRLIALSVHPVHPSRAENLDD
jgi:hypothetical protein